MTQAQRTQTGANGLVPAAVAGLVMVAALTGAILVYGLPTLSLTPGTGTVTTNAALIQSQERWMQERLAQSLPLTSVAAAKSARQWEAMQHVLAPAATSSGLTEAQRQEVIRHQLMLPEMLSGASNLERAMKLQIERQVASGVTPTEFVGQRKAGGTDPWSDDDIRTPRHPQLR